MFEVWLVYLGLYAANGKFESGQIRQHLSCKVESFGAQYRCVSLLIYPHFTFSHYNLFEIFLNIALGGQAIH